MKKIKLILALAGATLLSASALAVDNNPPMVNGIPGESIQEGGKFATIKLDNYVSDDMDKPEQIKWSVSGNKNLKVSIKNRVATIETPHPYWNGEENITFAATDSKGAIGSETVTFTVKHVFDENGFCRCDDYQPAEKNDDGYYKIANAGNLYWFADFVNQGNFTANAVLTNNIVVNTLKFADGEIVTGGWVYRVWSPIGPDYIYPYQGTFDGNGHTISGLYFNDPDQDFVGLFGCNNGTIQNAGVVDSYFYGKDHVGGVCGGNAEGKIENCYNAGNVNGSRIEVGGVCGYNFEGKIENCYNTGEVNGEYSVGGVCGYNFEGKIENCYNTGNVNGSFNEVGGVCGYNAGGTITNCHNTGNVNGSSNYVGGVCGYNRESTITNCYNTGEVNGDSYVGGVLGDLGQYCNIENCYNTGVVSGNGDYVGGVCGYNRESTITNCYYLNSSASEGLGDGLGEATAQTAEEFADGTVTSLLNANGNNAWKQGLNYPMLISNHIHEYANGLCVICNEYQQPTKDGNGVYQIANAGNLYWFMEYVNNNAVYDENADAYLTKANAVLVDDITVNKNLLLSLEKDEDGNVTNGNTFKAWNTIGCFNSGYNEFAYYAGIFDGQGHAISGLYLNNQSLDCVGLFGAINGATIKNVGVVDSYFEGSYYAGGVCGLNSKGHIINCYNTGDVKDSGGFAGGVCGTNDKGAIENCYSTGDVKGEGDTGGVCGYSEDGSTITNCYFLSGTDANATQATAEQFASGEVAYKLGGAFFQTIGEDALPVLDNTHGKVYQTSPCGIAYSNTENAVLEHNFDENGFCTACGAYEPATDSDADGYYEIANAGNLYWFADFVNDMANAEEGNRIYYSSANAVLTADITVNENLLSRLVKDNDGNVTNGDDFKAWNPIGFYYNYGWNVYYAGTFDGNGHTISGLYFNNGNQGYVGLIGLTTEGAVIKNVGVIDSYFKGKYCIGGVCGENYEGTITNCYNSGEISVGNGSYNIGGVCGENYYGTIENCYNSGEISVGNGSYDIGGVCGYNDGTIENCYYLASTDDGNGGKTADQFADGTVAKLLFASDTIWGQNTSTDTVPNLSGKIIFKVTLTAENGIAENGLGEYNKKYEIKATPNAGYHFVEWSNGSTEIKDSILVVNDTALVATFEAHSFGNWDTTLVATCAVAGLRARACACGEVETDTIAKLAHTIVVDSAKTATCTATGLTEGKHCSVCDSILVAQQTIAKLAHTIVVDSAKTATCTVAGLTEGKHCSVCDSILVKQETIPAGHTIVVDSSKTATCTAEGLTEGKHCSVCDSIFVAQQTIAKLAHTIVVDSAKTATCTATGLTEGKHCSVCNEVIKAQDTIPALGHSFTNYIYNNDATYEADGTEKAECDREGCNAIDVRTAEGTKLQTSVGTELAEGVVIYAHHSTIVVENAVEDIFIYNADGRMIARETVTANRMEMPMTEQGIYIVRTGDTTQRVFVK